MDLTYEIKHYTKLSVNEFHDMISLRMEIFGVEQQAIYNDLDGYDKNCHHLIVTNTKNLIVATARILPPELKYSEASIGRIVLQKSYRNNGVGHTIIKDLLNFTINTYPESNIKISAMKYLQQFYETYAFVQSGDVYLDCDIEHIDMVRPVTGN